MTWSWWARVACTGIAVGSAACSEPLPPLSWRIHFASEAEGGRAEVVEAEIRAGSCAGEVVFSSRGVRDGSAAAPGSLPAGPYGFFARARDGNCLWFAEACVERALPSSAPVDLMLVTVPAAQAEPNCELIDDEPPAFDAGAKDAGGTSDDNARSNPLNDGDVSSSALLDAAPEPSVDATAEPRENPDPPTTLDDARCRAIDGATVACYDFSNTLLDSSSFANHAVAQDTTFEPLEGLHALRPLGRAVSVADEPSLNVSAFTIEVWMRADTLTNLSRDGDEFSLLADKDRQYSVGIDALGSPVMTIYRDRDRFEHTTATDISLSVGTSYYLAFSYDGTTARIYLDGRQVDSERIELPLSEGVAGPLFIGSGSPNATRPFDGLIDALRISNVARSAAYMCAAASKTSSANSCQ